MSGENFSIPKKDLSLENTTKNFIAGENFFEKSFEVEKMI